MKTTYLNQQAGYEKLTLGLTAVLVLAFAGFFFIFQGQKTKTSQSETHNINYEMAKAKSAEALYSLDGREIDRDNQELESSIPAGQVSAIQTSKNSKIAAVAAQAKAQKKTATTAAAAAATAQKAAADLKSKQIKLKSTEQSLKTASEVEKKSNDQVQANLNSNPKQVIANTNDIKTDVTEKSEDKKDVKTISQWSAEIFATSDRQIILKFVTAFKNKEITDAEFYSVTNKLLTSPDEAKKGFGLYALRATPSYNSYVALVKIQNSVNPTYQAYIQETLLSYHQPSSLGYLNQALNSNNKQIILKTLEIVNIGVTDVKNGTTSGLVDSRYRRDADFMTFAIQNYQSFLPQLTLLQSQSQQSGDRDIYKAAGQLAQTIQSSAVVASNQ